MLLNPVNQEHKLRQWFTLLCIAGLTACAGSAPKPESPPDKGGGEATSSVDITYMLGHNQRRFYAESKAGGVLAQTFLDRQIVEAGQIDREHYLGFLKKASSFIDAAGKTSLERIPCRSPFTVTVRVGEATQATKGCRSADESGISHLVRDGEFLLFSKKAGS